MEIKTAGIEDAVSISDLLKASIDELNSRDYPKSHIDAWKKLDSPENIEERLEDNELRHFLAVENKEIVGFLSVSVRESILNSLYVKPSKTGHGIGSELLEFAEMLLQSHGKAEMTLNSTKTALDFYKKRGYVEKRNIQLLIEGVKIPVIKLVKKFSISKIL